MDEKTERLRDIFLDSTGAETVTESQEERRGSLAEVDRDIERRVEAVIERMRDRYEFRTDLSTEELCTIVEGYFDEQDDGTVAAELDIDSNTVFDARMDLHLVGEADREASFDIEELRRLLVTDTSVTECAEALDLDVDVVNHYADVIRADLEATRANDRFHDEFAELLTDTDLSVQHVMDAHEDGLREATEDIETDVSF